VSLTTAGRTSLSLAPHPTPHRTGPPCNEPYEEPNRLPHDDGDVHFVVVLTHDGPVFSPQSCLSLTDRPHL